MGDGLRACHRVRSARAEGYGGKEVSGLELAWKALVARRSNRVDHEQSGIRCLSFMD